MPNRPDSPAALPASIDIDIGGIVHERLDGADRLAPAAARQVAGALLPLRNETPSGEPTIHIEVVDHVAVPQTRAEFGVRVTADGHVWVGDHLDRGALLAFPDGKAIAYLDRQADPSVLDLIRQPLLEAGLAAAGGGTLRTACVEVGGRRVAIAGWSGNGKTQVVLQLLLQHGGRLIGDDLIAVTPDGSVAPLWLGLTLRAEHANLLPGSLRRSSGLKRAAARGLARLAENRSAPRRARALTDAAARMLRYYTESRVGVQELVPGSRPGRIGPLDALLLLGESPGAVDPVRLLASFGGSYSAHLVAVEATLRSSGLERRLLPDFETRSTIAARALQGAEVLFGQANDGAQAKAVARTLLDAGQATSRGGLHP